MALITIYLSFKAYKIEMFATFWFSFYIPDFFRFELYVQLFVLILIHVRKDSIKQFRDPADFTEIIPGCGFLNWTSKLS